MVNMLIKLTENDKRLIIAIVLVFIIILAILILICLLIEKVCKEQGKKIDKLMHDVVLAGVIQDSKQFKKVANRKNKIQFYREVKLPFIILLGLIIASIIYMGCTNDWNFAGFFSDYGQEINGTYQGGKGFTTIMYLWDFSNFPTTQVFGIKVISDWAPLIQAPHGEVSAIFSYFFCPLFVASLGWIAIRMQAFAARTYRIHKLARSIYDKSLDNVKFDNLFNFKYVNGAVSYNKEEAPVTQTQNQPATSENNNQNPPENIQ